MELDKLSLSPSLQPSCYQREVDVPQQPAEAEEDDATLDGDIRSAEEVCNRPDFVRIEDETEQFLSISLAFCPSEPTDLWQKADNRANVEMRLTFLKSCTINATVLPFITPIKIKNMD